MKKTKNDAVSERHSNKTVLITRRREEAGDGLSALTEAGFKLFFFPTIETVYVEPENVSQFSNKIFDYVIFSSANAVKFFLVFLKKRDVDFNFGKVTVAATGSKTAERCEANNIKVEIIPQNFSAKGLIEYFSSIDVRGKKFLIPSSQIAREELSEGLESLGAEVTRLTVYDTVKANPESDKLEQLKNSIPDIFVFTSPSSFNNFLELADIEEAKKYFSGKEIFAIGKTTADAINNSGIKNVKYPEEYTLNKVTKMIAKSLPF